MRFEEYKKGVEIQAHVRKKKYSLAQVASIPSFNDRTFAIVTDGTEISVIAEEDSVKNVLKEERDLRIITFDTKVPFDLIGFLAYITKLLADHNISLFAISAFSNDHILLKNEYLERAVDVLKDAKVKIIYS